MEGVIKIQYQDENGAEKSLSLSLKSTGGTIRRYKEQTGRDMIADLQKLAPLVKEFEKGKKADLSSMDITIFQDILWAMAKTYDNSILPPLQWLDSFEIFPTFDILEQAMPLFEATVKSSLTLKNI